MIDTTMCSAFKFEVAVFYAFSVCLMFDQGLGHARIPGQISTNELSLGFFVCLFYFKFFETVSLYRTVAVLELTL